MLLEPAMSEPDADLCGAPEAGALWPQHGARPEGDTRAALVGAYQRLVRMLAARAYGRRATAELEFDEYLQFAQVGLLEAIDRFEPQRGIKFETFASRRISGAIMNGLANATELQEQLAVRRRVVAGRAEVLSGERDEDGGSEDVFARLAEAAIGLALGFMLEGSGMYREDDDQADDSTYSRLELRQLREQVRAAVSRLPERQREVIQSHYLHNEPFEQVAERLKLSRGRVSQLHADGLRRLRALLAAPGLVDFSC